MGAVRTIHEPLTAELLFTYHPPPFTIPLWTPFLWP